MEELKGLRIKKIFVGECEEELIFVTDKTGTKTVEILGLRIELDPNQKDLNFLSMINWFQ